MSRGRSLRSLATAATRGAYSAPTLAVARTFALDGVSLTRKQWTPALERLEAVLAPFVAEVAELADRAATTAKGA